jgi:Fur family transcriptional regulator, peroxide stress response regulator
MDVFRRGPTLTPKAIVTRRVKAYLEVCSRHAIKVTHQRYVILQELAGNQEHPDVEAIYRKVRCKIPSISLDTVYRALRLFEDKGIISRVGSIKDRTRFDTHTEPHHHFICSRCGLIGDFASETFNQLTAPVEVGVLGQIDCVYVELRGVCRKCLGNHQGKPDA